MRKIIWVIMALAYVHNLNCQKQICDTSGYYFYYLKKNNIAPKYECDVYIINALTRKRFLELNEDYKLVLNQGLDLDALQNQVIDSFELNSKKLQTIYDHQKTQINDMNTYIMPKLDSSIGSLNDATKNLNAAKVSMDNAIEEIKKSKNKKWVYAIAGFLAGSLTIALIK